MNELQPITKRWLKDLYKKLNPEGHWFDKKTMELFKSSICPLGYKKDPDFIYFISREVFEPSTGEPVVSFTIREMNRKTGNIGNTFKEYCKKFKTKEEAEEELIDFLSAENDV
jgi:hypothetical protein